MQIFVDFFAYKIHFAANKMSAKSAISTSLPNKNSRFYLAYNREIWYRYLALKNRIWH